MMYVANSKKFTSQQKYDECIKLIKILIDTSGLKVESYGLENIPKKDGFYLCSNHQEKFDPLAIWYCFPRRVGVILDDRATHRPFISEVCKMIKSKKLHYRKMHKLLKSFDEVTEELKSGINYLVFPEGGYEQEDGKLTKFQTGCFKSPKRAKCPIVPVCVIDSFKIFDKGYRTTYPIQIHYLKPISPKEYEGLSTTEMAELVKARIQKELDKYQK
ncbi:MAG: 1-acyl-sn-glycerol-3-phosphate acyltransferase [Treponema sp.]|nr:1-acyl-sn-glycerol-3-phosphate acyltransferase [Candidatus Treponema scatequi]